MMKLHARWERSRGRWLAEVALVFLTVAMTAGCATVDIDMKQQAPPGTAGIHCAPCPECPDECDGDVTHAQLSVDVPELVAWMVLNSTFTEAEHTAATHEHRETDFGFVMQLGDYPDPYGPGDVFYRVSIDGQEFCLPSEADCELPAVTWIEIVPHGTPDSERMTDADFAQLFPEPVHDRFSPRALLTYFTGPNGYEFSLTNRAGDDDPPLQTFSFRDPIDVHLRIEDGGSTTTQTFENARSIDLSADPGTDHGRYHDPPMVTPGS